MINYLIRKIAYALPVLAGVSIITFLLFFSVNSPDSIARMHLGEKYATATAIERWKQQHGYDKPAFYNPQKNGLARLTDTLFFTKTSQLFRFNFGFSVDNRRISTDILQRMWPSLAIAAPTLLLGLCINISFALFVILFRTTLFDTITMITCVLMMSISSLFYVIFGQYLFGKILQWVPVSGYEGGLAAFRFITLPVLIGVISGMGAGIRWYRTLFLEEMHKEYVTTARAKGLSPFRLLYQHVLRNALLPILTGAVVIIPSLFLGSLIMESFFGIPGLGSYTIDAIQSQDFEVVRAMVFLGTLLYLVGLILTDVSYTLADPRVRLGGNSV